jgi:hypothetical protein
MAFSDATTPTQPYAVSKISYLSKDIGTRYLGRDLIPATKRLSASSAGPFIVPKWIPLIGGYQGTITAVVSWRPISNDANPNHEMQGDTRLIPVPTAYWDRPTILTNVQM